MSSAQITEQISKLLKEFREKADLTQTEVAKKAGLHPNAYAKIERGERLPNLDTLQKICKALGVKSSDVLPF